jgi:hypothetical protein
VHSATKAQSSGFIFTLDANDMISGPYASIHSVSRKIEKLGTIEPPQPED